MDFANLCEFLTNLNPEEIETAIECISKLVPRYEREYQEIVNEFEKKKHNLNESFQRYTNVIKSVYEFKNKRPLAGTNFNDFVQAMKDKKRIVVITYGDTPEVYILNDPNFKYGPPDNYSSGMKGFRLEENTIKWWEHSPGYCQEIYRFAYVGDTFTARFCRKDLPASWYISDDTDIAKYAFPIMKIEYPSG